MLTGKAYSFKKTMQLLPKIFWLKVILTASIMRHNLFFQPYKTIYLNHEITGDLP